MKGGKGLALAFAAFNLALLLLFPPYDYLSIQYGNVPTFDGFLFVFGSYPNHRINAPFLTIEIIVVLVNLAIVWLLLGRRVASPPPVKINRAQRILLTVVAVNLALMLMFPPFENYLAISKAALPTFEGFYFIFGNNAQRQIVTAILYLEISLVLINGALLWLLLRDKSAAEIAGERLGAMARTLQDPRKGGGPL